jgi:hypothetical protein
MQKTEAFHYFAFKEELFLNCQTLREILFHNSKLKVLDIFVKNDYLKCRLPFHSMSTFDFEEKIFISDKTFLHLVPLI